MKVYSDLSVGDTAAAIFKDIVYDGISSDWEPADVVGIAQVKKYLEPYNIHYAGDGVWKYEVPRKGSCSPKFSVGQYVYCSGPFGTVSRCIVDEIVIRRWGIAYHLNDGTVLAEEGLSADAGPLYDERIKEVKSKIEGLEKELKVLEDAKKGALGEDEFYPSAADAYGSAIEELNRDIEAQRICLDHLLKRKARLEEARDESKRSQESR